VVYPRVFIIIGYNLVDWANDNTDWGVGYDYDNSYQVLREPLRCELVIRDGVFFGFKVHSDHVLAPGDFADGLVEEVVGKINIQDKPNWFDDRARPMLKLTPEAVADPDGTLVAFAEFYPILAKVR